MIRVISERKVLKEAYELHDTLNPKLFDTETQELKPEVLEKLQGIAEEFLKSIDPLTISVADIELVGSNASYNYNDKSDIDLHIITNFDLSYIDKEVLQSIYNDKKNKFNEKYDFELYGIPVEVYVEDVNAGNATKGIYSILHDNWVMKPEPIHYDIPDYTKELNEWKSKINEVLQSGDKNEVEATLNDIYMMRKNGLAIDGEMSIGNLVFKELRNVGLLDGLRNKYHEIVSDELSLKESLVTEGYKDSEEFQGLIKQKMALEKQLNDLKQMDPGSNYPSDEEMKEKCNMSDEDWKYLGKIEKQMFYDMSCDDNKEHEEIIEKEIAVEKQISDINEKMRELKNKEFERQGGNTYEGDLPEKFEGESEYFKFDTGEYHQDYLENLDYAKSKGYTDCYISKMSPDEYMDRCSKQIFKSPIEDTHDSMENKHNIENYANKMKEGTKFYMPYIDLKINGQEGRHRAMAAKMLGAKEIPVLFLY